MPIHSLFVGVESSYILKRNSMMVNWQIFSKTEIMQYLTHSVQSGFGLTICLACVTIFMVVVLGSLGKSEILL